MYVSVCIMDLPALRSRFTYEHCVMYFCRCNVRKSEDDSNITILRATKVNYKSIHDVIMRLWSAIQWSYSIALLATRL